MPRPRSHGQRRLDEFDGAAAGGALPPGPRRPPALPGVWRVSEGTVEHPLLKAGSVRALPFQLDLARIGLTEDLLVVLPTGLGKTVIAALVAAEMLRREAGRLLFLAPTRPLVQQHADWFARHVGPLSIARFTGTVARPHREGSWEAAEAVFATPQLVVNDLREGRYDLRGVGFLVFDEAHHAVGKYAYVPIAARFRAERPPGARLMGLTASPGGKDERIEEVVGALGVTRIEARTRDDDGVREHVQPITIEQRWVDLPAEIERIREPLEAAHHEVAHKLQKIGYLRKKPIASLSVKDLVALRAEIFARPGPMVRKFGPLFHQLVLLHLHHALERLETQGVVPFLQYVDRVEHKEKPSRGDRAFVALDGVARARRMAKERAAAGGASSHPKLEALVGLLKESFAQATERPLRVLVFAQYRDTIQGIQEALAAEGWRAGRFVGQATREGADPGMNQREQARVLAEFRERRYPVLVASSVAEEGLDIPDVDLVVFFESTPSEIRAIQRRGRTGRSSLGRVVLLLTRGTREVGYQRAEARREQAMGRIVRRLSRAARARSVADRERAAPPEGGADRGSGPPGRP
jgi:ERCC4-related helicase